MGNHLSSAIENHELISSLKPQTILDIIDIYDKLSTTDHNSTLAGSNYLFENYKKAFFGDEEAQNQPGDLKLDQISQATLSSFSALFRHIWVQIKKNGL